MPVVSIVPVYLGDREHLLSELTASVARTFQVTARIRAPWFDPESCFDGSRGQYNARAVLRQLLTIPDDGLCKVLGLIGRDLFCPALAYVFGEAQLAGRAAVVSLERLRTEAYGLPRDDRLLGERLRKEAIHELGHVYGLVHCRDTACVMHPSTWAEQIDFKSARFCVPCEARLAVR